MANIYDMNAAIDKPNILGAVQQGMQFGQQQRKLREDRADQQQLRNLAPAIMGGDPNAYEQAAVIDPKAAQGYQDTGDSQYRRLKGAVDLVNQRRALAKETGDMRYVNAALREVGPYFSKLIGKPIPAEWTPDMDEGWAQLEARVAMADQKDASADPAGFRQFEMTARAAGLTPGTPEYQQAANIALGREGRAATGGFGFELVEGPDGRKRMSRKNPRTGAYEIYNEQTGDFEQVGSPSARSNTQQAAPQPGTYQTPNGIVRVGDLTPDQWAAAQADINGGGTTDSVTLPQRDVSPAQFGARPNPGLAVGRSPEEQAGLTTAAQEQAKLQYLAQQEAIKKQAEVDAARQKSEQETSAERTKTRMEKEATLRVYEAAVQGLEQGLGDTATGPIVGRLPAMTAQQQIAEGGVAAMAPILKQLFRTAGEGTFTDKDQELLLAMVPTRQDLPASRDSKLANIDRIVRAKLASPSGGAAPQTTPTRRARNPQTGEVLVLRNGQWMPE